MYVFSLAANGVNEWIVKHSKDKEFKGEKKEDYRGRNREDNGILYTRSLFMICRYSFKWKTKVHSTTKKVTETMRSFRIEIKTSIGRFREKRG